jgi:hypothetical protein
MTKSIFESQAITLAAAQAALDKIARDRAQLLATRVSLEERLAFG